MRLLAIRVRTTTCCSASSDPMPPTWRTAGGSWRSTRSISCRRRRSRRRTPRSMSRNRWWRSRARRDRGSVISCGGSSMRSMRRAATRPRRPTTSPELHLRTARPDLPEPSDVVPDRPWPDASGLRALAALLCRPSPPFVAAERLAASPGLVALAAAQPDEPPDAALVSRLHAGLLAFRRSGGALVTFWDDAYPSLLRHIARPPVALFVRGEIGVLDATVVAIVGARAASRAACSWTRSVAADLARCG